MKPRFIAYYLPQYHPIPENDNWWGKGFTEWRSVAQARPLFPGHYQPHIPADLGFYDLRLPETRGQQAEMAKLYGIEGFMYWHYWMGNGKMLLDRPFREVLSSGEPDFPFCLGWANHSWSNKTWTRKSNFVKERNVIDVVYDEEDYVHHFYHLLPAFQDHRYIRVDGKPLFHIFAPNLIPDFMKFKIIWNELAINNGLTGIFFVGNSKNILDFHDSGKYDLYSSDKMYNKIIEMGFDAVNSRGDFRAELLQKGVLSQFITRGIRKFFNISLLKKYDYKGIVDNLFVKEDSWDNVFPTVIPNWDRSPRAGKDAVIYHNSTPVLFQKMVENAIQIVKNKPIDRQIIFIKSWNEWGEGNHLEPDLKYGNAYLQAIKNAIEANEEKQ